MSSSDEKHNAEFERLHEIGAKRHPAYWLAANQAAGWGVRDLLDVTDPRVRLALTRLVRKVLDVAAPAQGENAPTVCRCGKLARLVDERDKEIAELKQLIAKMERLPNVGKPFNE